MNVSKKKPTQERPRTHLVGVVTATLIDDVLAQIDALRMKEGGQPESDMLGNSSNQTFPKGADHGKN